MFGRNSHQLAKRPAVEPDVKKPWDQAHAAGKDSFLYLAKPTPQCHFILVNCPDCLNGPKNHQQYQGSQSEQRPPGVGDPSENQCRDAKQRAANNRELLPASFQPV